MRVQTSAEAEIMMISNQQSLLFKDHAGLSQINLQRKTLVVSNKQQTNAVVIYCLKLLHSSANSFAKHEKEKRKQMTQ